MLLLPLIIHLLNNLSKDAHVVELEGERSGTSALGSEYAGGVCVRALHKDINEWEREQSAKGTRVGRRLAPLVAILPLLALISPRCSHM